MQEPPSDYMIYTIFSTICCFWPVGIAAIVRSTECRAAIARGDMAAAEEKSRAARHLANWAVGVGSVLVALVVTAVVVVIILLNR